ncbi:hypothetical protein [Bacillus sp. FJAT-29937]|uniref:hypothetical protein n=1 Tax=Bacillus sp. FJAT-29937 TaxID=1720553 RepID=UPI00083411A6|nr:hypothetical protein [Bacillus sp. FJAT-29937]
MRKTKLLSIVLLTVFFSFLIAQYPGGHTKRIIDPEHHAVISSDSTESFLVKDDIKKFLFNPNFNIEALYLLTLALSLFCSKLIGSSQRGMFFTPIFYQSNYVVFSPSFS